MGQWQDDIWLERKKVPWTSRPVARILQQWRHILWMQCWMYAATGEPNMKWGHRFWKGMPGTTADGPVVRTSLKLSALMTSFNIVSTGVILRNNRATGHNPDPENSDEWVSLLESSRNDVCYCKLLLPAKLRFRTRKQNTLRKPIFGTVYWHL